MVCSLGLVYGNDNRNNVCLRGTERARGCLLVCILSKLQSSDSTTSMLNEFDVLSLSEIEPGGGCIVSVIRFNKNKFLPKDWLGSVGDFLAKGWDFDDGELGEWMFSHTPAARVVLLFSVCVCVYVL